ncbi:uncharacterized protein UTRI_05864 [Ustilago trichophora]|uniref:Uncharacterized protein n=1 Tax=Ustilago trichophora TaxID=86804 RepID=A0A5C3EIY1_9BASI|nr:uncharacterized protein UTRI_05864 [Ustilago trichophora]
MALLLPPAPSMTAKPLPVTMAMQTNTWYCAALAGYPPPGTIEEQLLPAQSLDGQMPRTLLAQDSTLFPPAPESMPGKLALDIRQIPRFTSQALWLQGQSEQEQSETFARDVSASLRRSLPSDEQNSEATVSIGHAGQCVQNPFVGSSGLELHGLAGAVETLAPFQDYRTPLQLSPFHAQAADQLAVDKSATSGGNLASLFRSDVTDGGLPSWDASIPHTAPGPSGSLGLFIPAESQMTLPSVFQTVLPSVDSQSIASRPSDGTMKMPPVASGSGSALASAQKAPTSKRYSLSTVEQAEQQMLDYKRTLTDAHTGRLGGLLGLPHPLPPTSQHDPTSGLSSATYQAQVQDAHLPLSSPASGPSQQPSVLPISSPSWDAKPSWRPSLPREVVSASVFIISRDDTILWFGDSMKACSNDVRDFCLNSVDSDNDVRSAAGLSEQRLKLSDLLADEQAVGWWQQACREVLLKQLQLQRLSQQLSDGDESFQARAPYKKELILRWRCQRGDDVLVELSIVATTMKRCEEGLLMVKVKPVSIPTIARVSSQRMVANVNMRSPVSSRTSVPDQAVQGIVPEKAELRLLVSRYGLVLRASCPPQTMGSSVKSGSPGYEAEARATFAILGDGASMPVFGQSLVDIPKLTPLLHVVAQAAVVGLAQTVKLNSGGRQVTAVVQPVLRTPAPSQTGSRRSNAPAAKVWVSLSAAATINRRPKSSSNLGSFSAFMGLSPSAQQSLSRPISLDRRHSVQSFSQNRDSPVPDFHPGLLFQGDRRASMASVYAHAALAQAAATRQQHAKVADSDSGRCIQPTTLAQSQFKHTEQTVSVEDYLSFLVAKLQKENLLLRQEVEARRRMKNSQIQSQPQLQPPISSLDTQFYSPRKVPGSCPSALQYLS